MKAIEGELKEIDAATVHKFQGKEKDEIIISTVDDLISDFVDDPYLSLIHIYICLTVYLSRLA